MAWFWRRKPRQNDSVPIKDSEEVVFRRRTSQKKLAVFQVTSPGERAALVCLEIRSLQAAAEFEHWLRMNVDDRTEVKLLGRFDSVHFPSTETGTESVVFGSGLQSTLNQP